MNYSTSFPLWQGIGASVRGISHARTDQPNQDAIYYGLASEATAAEQPIGQGPPLILAVSDGHGSLRNFRSQIGSQIAVTTAAQVVQELLLDSRPEEMNFSTIKDIAHTRLPQRLVHEWTKAVQEHWQNNPVAKDDPIWEALVIQSGLAAPQTIDNNPEIAYGATLLIVLVTDSFVLYLQLGDGDILCVDSKSNVTRPLQRDQRLIANETTSLCMTEAWKEFQISLALYPEQSSHQMPALILVSTDGYANSFPSEAEFLKIGPDYLNLIRTEGIAQVEQQLPHFLQETSENGSRDDITLGLLKRLDKSEQEIMQLQKQHTRNEEDRKQLVERQKKLSHAMFHTILGLSVTFVLAILNLSSNIWIWSRYLSLTQQVKALETQVDSSNLPQSGQPQPSPASTEPIPTPTPTPNSAP